MAGYNDTIRRWAADVRRAGTLADADGIGEIGLGRDEAGKRLAVRFALRVRAGHAQTVRYQVFGCGFTMAACAVTADLAEGRPLADIAVAITPAIVDTALAGLPAERDYCAVLAVQALQAAVDSALHDHHPVQATASPAGDDHTPRVTAADPVYRLLIATRPTSGTEQEDRHLFACLLAVAATESGDIAGNLGLTANDLVDLLDRYFPGITLSQLADHGSRTATSCPPANPDLVSLLMTYLPVGVDGRTALSSLWLARIVATRAACAGHLWRAMGLFARPELTAAIRRHLPELAAANSMGMRWKRFLFRQLCERSGGMMCKTPDCGLCSDYALCFGDG
jgi:nitrogen fixation protein NifQ